MRDLLLLPGGVEPGTVLSASWVAENGPPLGYPGLAWVRESGGSWRAVRAEGVCPARPAPASTQVEVLIRRRAA